MKRVAVITGASSGIGASAAVELARRGWSIAVVGRNPERTRAVAKAAGGEAYVVDFDSLDSVATLASQLRDRFPRIEALVNNAGGYLDRRAESVDGVELTLQRNVLAGYLLTQTLLPTVQASAGRIIHTSSIMHRFARLRIDDLEWTLRPYRGGWGAYAEAKLGVLLYARDLARRTGVESYAFHPGYVATGFGPQTGIAGWTMRAALRFAISPAAGAAPLVHLVDTPELGVPNGAYFDGLQPGAPTHPAAKNPEIVSSYVESLRSRVG